jgi:hypothetical protein
MLNYQRVYRESKLLLLYQTMNHGIFGFLGNQLVNQPCPQDILMSKRAVHLGVPRPETISIYGVFGLHGKSWSNAGYTVHVEYGYNYTSNWAGWIHNIMGVDIDSIELSHRYQNQIKVNIQKARVVIIPQYHRQNMVCSNQHCNT